MYARKQSSRERLLQQIDAAIRKIDLQRAQRDQDKRASAVKGGGRAM